MNARDRTLVLLRADPADVGCDHVVEVMDIYVELVLAGRDPELELPGVTAHISDCSPCADDVAGLLAAVGP